MVRAVNTLVGNGTFGMKKILLVEDDLNMLELLEDLIEDEGYVATSAMDCRSAEKALRAESPDLILLDIGLPDGNSFDICLSR